MRRIVVLISALVALVSVPSSAQECGLTGFANYRDLGLHGTTGGGTATPVHVTTRSALETAAKGSTPAVIIIDADMEGNGVNDVKDVISVGSNKTIIGGGSGATLKGIGLDLNGQQNVIIRNIKITKAKPDALAFRDTHHVWVDHCDLSDSDDGLLDFTIGSSYLTVSWTKFSNHDKVSICNSGTNHFEDNGKERATYHHCLFTNTTQRNPRFGFGLGHVFNNYYTKNSSYCVGYHTQAKVVVENSMFYDTKTPLCQMYTDDPVQASYADVLSRGNAYQSTSGNTKDTGVGFDISRYYDYSFAMQEASAVEAQTSSMGLADGVENFLIPFPGNGATDVLSTDRLQVGAVTGATAYTYMIGQEGDDESAFTPYDAATTQLQPSTTYQWYAVATTPTATIKSTIFRFTTASLKASKPTPVDGDEQARLREALTNDAPLTPAMLRWRDAYQAASYRVYLSRGTTVGDDDYLGEVTTAQISPGALQYGASYAWRVDAVSADGTVTQGDVWTFSSDKKEAGFGRTEMEEAVRNGYAYLEPGTAYRSYSGGYAVVGEDGPGSMSVVWKEDAATCDITTTFFDWQKKNRTYHLYVNEQEKDTWIAQVDGANMFTHVSKGIALEPGDELRLEFYAGNNMRMRTDCIDIADATPSGISEALAPSHAQPLRIYTLDGRYVGSAIERVPSGIYIVNGKKVVK